MRKLVFVLAVLALPAAALAQELPKVTAEGKQALEKLIAECKKGGAIKDILDPKSGKTHLQADREKLRTAVRQQRGLLTPALRDTLVNRWQEPALVTLL